MFGKFRISVNAPTRHPDQRPKSLPIFVRHGAYRERIDVPVERYPIVAVVLPNYGVPYLLRDEESPDEVPMKWQTYHGARRGASGAAIYSSMNLEISQKVNLIAFHRLLAKIAHGFAVAEFGIDGFADWLLPPLIRGETSVFPDLIGGTKPLVLENYSGRPIHRPLLKHAIKTDIVESVKTKTRYLAVSIQLFIDCTPEYQVLVARFPREATESAEDESPVLPRT